MVPHVRGADAYRRVEAQSRSPLELVIMLYDGALRFLTDARTAAASKDLAGRSRGVTKTLAIVGELQSTLNVAQGGSVAAELDRLYTYVTGRLLDVSLKQDAGAIDEVYKLLSTVRDGWVQVAGQGARP